MKLRFKSIPPGVYYIPVDQSEICTVWPTTANRYQRSVNIWIGFMLILFNVKLFTKYYSDTSKDMQCQGKLRSFKMCCQRKFVFNVHMVAENFTFFVTQLVTYRGQVHTHKFIQRNKKLFIYFFNHYIYCILKTYCIASDLFSTN